MDGFEGKCLLPHFRFPKMCLLLIASFVLPSLRQPIAGLIKRNESSKDSIDILIHSKIVSCVGLSFKSKLKSNLSKVCKYLGPVLTSLLTHLC